MAAAYQLLDRRVLRLAPLRAGEEEGVHAALAQLHQQVVELLVL